MIEKFNKIINSFDKTKKNYAVFDCDNTLIYGDVEQLTLAYQLEKQEYRVSLEYVKSKLAHYKKFKKEIENLELNHKFKELTDKIYVDTMNDISLILLEQYTKQEVYELTKKALEYYKDKFSLREDIKQLLDILRKNNIEIYVCSASVLYEVYVASDMYGIKRENVMAVDMEEDENGKLIYKEKGIITRGQGKVDAINNLGYNYPPVIIAGDSDGDYYMMTRFNADHVIIINPKENTKVKQLVDNYRFFEYIM